MNHGQYKVQMLAAEGTAFHGQSDEVCRIERCHLSNQERPWNRPAPASQHGDAQHAD